MKLPSERDTICVGMFLPTDSPPLPNDLVKVAPTGLSAENTSVILITLSDGENLAVNWQEEKEKRKRAFVEYVMHESHQP